MSQPEKKIDPSPIAGIIRGYAAIFGVRDPQGDVIQPGAFSDAIAKGQQVEVYWGHSYINDPNAKPIGKTRLLKEDEHGLYYEAEIADTQEGRDHLKLIQSGAVSKASFGFDVPAHGAQRKDGTRYLKKLNLIEVSTADWRAVNPLTTAEVVLPDESKSATAQETENLTRSKREMPEVKVNLPVEPEPAAASEDRKPEPEPAVAALTPDGLRSALEDALNPVRSELDNVKSALSDAKKEAAEAKSRADALEAKMQAPASRSGPAEVKSAFDAINESSAYNKYWANGHFPNGLRIGGHKAKAGDEKFPSLILSRSPEAKATVLGSTELSGLAVPTYRPGLYEYLEDDMGLVPMVPQVQVSGETYIVRRETQKSGFGYAHSTLNGAIDGDPTPTNTCTLTSSIGFETGMYVRIFSTESGVGMKRRKITGVNHTTHALTFATDDLDFDAADGDDVVSEAYGATAESAEKPYGYLEAETVTETLKVLAVILGLTQQRLNAAPELRSWVERVLRRRARRSLEWHLLYGADGTNDLAGFFSESGAQTRSWSGGAVGDSRADCVLKAGCDIPSAGTIALACNKADWLELIVEKSGGDKQYINSVMGPVRVVNEGPGRRFLGEHPVILSAAVRSGDFLMADFSKASELAINPAGTALAFGYINTDFATNQLRARYEDFCQHAILSIQAYVCGTWDSAPS